MQGKAAYRKLRETEVQTIYTEALLRQQCSAIRSNMGDETLQLCPAFNGQLHLREAYDYDRDDVYGFLNNVVNNPEQYGIDSINNGQLVTTLKKINDALQRLSLPSGPDFTGNNALTPDQHIYRRRNDGWVDGGEGSKFDVRHHFVFNIRPGNRIFYYWSPYDLLGLFLSIIGTAPAGASKNTFFLPLTAVYGRWCGLIAGHRAPRGRGEPAGVGSWPAMFQCTWRKRRDEDAVFSLGATLAGYAWEGPDLVGTWKRVLQTSRFNLIWDWQLLKDDTYEDGFRKVQHWDVDHSPAIVYEGLDTKFGNCAETYPFIDLLLFHDFDDGEQCFGLSLKRPFLDKNGYDHRREGRIWNESKQCCRNCRYLIELKCRDQLANFDAELDRQLAPENW